MNVTKDREIFEQIGKKIVLCIGNNLYLDSENYGKLRKCSNDAKKVYDYFMHQPALRGIEEKSILLCNDENKKITKNIIMESLKTITKNVDSLEQLVIFFSGHGEVIEDELAWVTCDSKLETGENYVKMSEINAVLEACRARDIFIIIDACYSGLAANDKKGGISRNSIEKLIKVSNGITVIASSRGNQPSMEKSPSENSLFLIFLCKALSGEITALNDYYLSCFSLYEYTVKEMIEYCRSCGLEEQIPTIKCTCEGVQILGDYRFRESNSWYKDNYAKIIVKEMKDEYIQWLNDLETYIDSELWEKLRNLVIELVLNAFLHGQASQSDIIIQKNFIELVDDGGAFNQFAKCKRKTGGASISIEQIEKKWNRDAKLEYKYDSKNHHYIRLSLEEAFDITRNCTIKINKCSFDFDNCVIVPESICKYYFLDIVANGPVSFEKRWVESAKKKIPDGSTLIVRKKDYHEVIFASMDNIEFV